MENVTQIFIDGINGDKEAQKRLKEIKQGVYLKVFRPHEELWERRRVGGEKHYMEAGSVVIKPGKFEGNLWGRCAQYDKSWFYSSSDKKAYQDNVTIYLMADLTGTGDYAKMVENNYISIVEDHLDVVKHEKGGSSEWRLAIGEVTEELIIRIHKELMSEIAWDCKCPSRAKRYNLQVLDIETI